MAMATVRRNVLQLKHMAASWLQHRATMGTSPVAEWKTWGGKVCKETPPGTMTNARLEYQKQVALLRKKYQKEEERKKAEHKQEEQAEHEQVVKGREEKEIMRQQYKEEVRLKTQEDRAALCVILEQQRARRAARREKFLAKVAARKEKQKENIRQASSSWIEEKDLEMRILESMVDPVRLIGTTTPSLESFEGLGSSIPRRKVEEDPLLRDSDDELMSAFGDRSKRPPPRVSGQDILASVTRSTKLQF